MQRCVKYITILLLILGLGLHWALLQTVAWTGMLIAYSREAGFSDAVAMTFDGQHPCALCHFVKSGRAEQERQDSQRMRPLAKPDCAVIWEGLNLCLSTEPFRIDVLDSFAVTRCYAPPKPRPRFTLRSSPAAAA